MSIIQVEILTSDSLKCRGDFQIGDLKLDIHGIQMVFKAMKLAFSVTKGKSMDKKVIDAEQRRRINTPKDVLFIIGDWNARVGSQETPGVTGKFGLVEYRMKQGKG